MYADRAAYERLLMVLRRRLGHALAGRAEEAKIAIAQQGNTRVALHDVAPELSVLITARQQAEALDHWFARIVQAALATCRLAQVPPAVIDAVYFTGGSTGLAPLRAALAQPFSQAALVEGERFSSVVQGLAISAQRRFGSATR